MTPKIATAELRTSIEKSIEDALGVDARSFAETVAGFLPFVMWLVAGIADVPRLAMAAYLAVGVLLVVRLHIGYLALLPFLFFFHPQGFEPHGPVFILSGAALASGAVRVGFGRLTAPQLVRPAIWCAVAFVALTAFQLLLSIHVFDGTLPLRAIRQFEQVFIVMSVLIVGLLTLPSRPLGQYFGAYLIGLVIVAVVAIIHFIEPRLLDSPGLAFMVPPNARETRASGVIASPNALGLALACGLAWILVSIAWSIARGRIERVTWLVATVPPLVLALLLSFSRAAILALGVGTLVAVARRSLRVAGLIAVGAILTIVFIYPLFVQVRLGQTFGEASPEGRAALAESDRLRTVMAVSAVEAFLEAPLAGHGFATFGEISPRYSGQTRLTSAHDLYLKVAAEQGLIGLAAFVALFISIGVPLWRAGIGPWVASLATFATFATFSLTIDSLGSAQAAAGAFFLIAAGMAQAASRREDGRDDGPHAVRREPGGDAADALR